LAEVLITLAIIGVIAAITIPSIVANHQKKTLETQFAKAYRTLQQATSLAIAEHGSMDTWDWSDADTNEKKEEFVKKYLVPYMNVVKFCPSEKPQAGMCFPDEPILNLNGTNHGNLGAKTHKQVQMVLADGANITLQIYPNCFAQQSFCMSLCMDSNGFKKPNVYGYDYHCYRYFPQTGEIAPRNLHIDGTYDEQTGRFEKRDYETISQKCKDEKDGYYCAAKIIMDGFKIDF